MRLPSVYPPQLLQLEDPQLLQELPVPATGAEAPEASFETQANLEKTLFDARLHSGQSAFSSAFEAGRSNSNLQLHFGHWYS